MDLVGEFREVGIDFRERKGATHANSRWVTMLIHTRLRRGDRPRVARPWFLFVGSVLLAVVLTGCDPQTETWPLDGAYLASFTVRGVAVETSRNSVTLGDATVTEIFQDVMRNPASVVPALGTTYDALTLEKFPKAPLWSPNDGGVFIVGREYTVFAGLLVQGGDETFTAWLGFDQLDDLPTAPQRGETSYVGVPVETVLTCLAEQYGATGASRHLDGLIGDVHRSRTDEPATDCYAKGTL